MPTVSISLNRGGQPFRFHDRRTIEEALRAEMLRVLPGPSPTDRAALEALPTRDMLLVFHNWQSRHIHPDRRLVLRPHPT